MKQIACDKCKKTEAPRRFHRLPKGWYRLHLKAFGTRSKKFDICAGCLTHSKGPKDFFNSHKLVTQWILEQPNCFLKNYKALFLSWLIAPFVTLCSYVVNYVKTRNRLSSKQSIALPKKST